MPSSFRSLHDDRCRATCLGLILLPLVLPLAGCTLGDIVAVPVAIVRAVIDPPYWPSTPPGTMRPAWLAFPVGSIGEYGPFPSGEVFVLHDFKRTENQSNTVLAGLMLNTTDHRGPVASYRIDTVVDCAAGTISLASHTQCSVANLNGDCQESEALDPPLGLLATASDTPEALRKSAAYICEKTKQGTIGSSAQQ